MAQTGSVMAVKLKERQHLNGKQVIVKIKFIGMLTYMPISLFESSNFLHMDIFFQTSYGCIEHP